MMRRGFSVSARANPIRWRWTTGELVRVEVDRLLGEADLTQQGADAFPLLGS